MTSLELLQEIDAWLSFNNSPSKEQISELRNDIKKHISEQLNILPVSGSLPSENQINNKAIEFSNKRYYKENNPHDTTINDFKAGVQWLLGYMAGNDR